MKMQQLRLVYFSLMLCASLVLSACDKKESRSVESDTPRLSSEYLGGTPAFPAVFGGSNSLPQGAEPIDSAGVLFRHQDGLWLRTTVKGVPVSVDAAFSEISPEYGVLAVGISKEKKGEPIAWNVYLKTPDGIYFNDNLLTKDVDSFVILEARAGYSRDSTYVYLHDDVLRHAEKGEYIYRDSQPADPETFVLLGVYPDTASESGYLVHAADARTVFYDGRRHPFSPSPQHYKILDEREGLYVVVRNNIYYRGMYTESFPGEYVTMVEYPGNGRAVLVNSFGERGYFWHGKLLKTDVREKAPMQPVLDSSRYSIIGSHVYFETSPIENAIPESFRTYAYDTDYSADDSQVYYRGLALLNADPMSFRPQRHVFRPKWLTDDILEEARAEGLSEEAIGNHIVHYGIDAKRVFLRGKELEGISSKGFGFINMDYVKDADHIFLIRNNPKVVKGADVATFIPLTSQGHPHCYGKDARYVYRDTERVLDADPATVKVIGEDIIQDANAVFFAGKKVDGLDPAKVEIIDGGTRTFLKDDNAVYIDGKLFAEADPATFSAVPIDTGNALSPQNTPGQPFPSDSSESLRLLGLQPSITNPLRQNFTVYTPYMRDGKRVWHRGMLVEGADPSTFVYRAAPFFSSAVSAVKHDARDAKYYYHVGKRVRAVEP